VNEARAISARRSIVNSIVGVLQVRQPYPYHLQRVQALSLQDYPARVIFCQWSLQRCGTNPNFLAFVIFTDGTQFTTDGI
jgi:hypothetical protein